MAALVRDYTLERGIQFRRQITINDTTTTLLDLTGISIAALVRLSRLPTDIRSLSFGTGPIVTAFDIIIAEPVTGKFIMQLPIAKTLLLQRAKYDYDVVLTFASADKRRILKGTISVEEIASDA